MSAFRSIALAAGFVSGAALAVNDASAGLRPLLPGEQIVYQSVQSGPNYRTFPPQVSQITGNAYTQYGDEVLLAGTNRYITNIAVGTQTFHNANTPAYMDGVNTSGGQDPVDTGGFLELSIYINDGPTDVAGDGSVWDSTPEGQSMPGTLLARSRVPTPTYPTGGTSPDSNGLNDLNNPSDNASDPWIVEFPFANVLVPALAADRITFSLINLNRNGVPDGHNSDGNQFGVWHALASTTNVVPGSGGPYYENTGYNTALVGTSRSGPFVSAANPGQWTWHEYLGKWESRRNSNNSVEATIYASEVPEPASLATLAALAGLLCARRPRQLAQRPD
jgi:hypothetical protein